MTWRAAWTVWVLTGAVVIGGCGGGDETPEPTSELAGPASEAAAPRPPTAGGTPSREPTAAAALKVNGTRRAQVSPGVPLVITVVVRQSSSAPERTPAAEPPKPVIRGGGGAQASATLSFLGADVATIAPGRDLTLRWVVQTPLAPGDYRLEWNPEGLFSIASPTPRVRAAHLRVLDLPTDPDELFFAELALLQAEGNVEEILRRVDGHLADDPGRLLALRVRAEALEQLAEPEQARATWMHLLALLRERAEAEEPGSEPEMAFWINARLGEPAR